jgi:effector-binding domain-containing protein
VHKEYDRYANAKLQKGVLPAWTHVMGKVVWYVHKGSYKGLPEAWAKFGKELASMQSEKFAGPPGDVYACDPMNHKGAEDTMITILWAPLKD